MKRLLCIWLVLAMVSVAGATLQISVNGDPDPVDSEIVLAPTETLTLDIWNDEVLPLFVAYAWALVADSRYGSISAGVSTHPSTIIGDPVSIPPYMEGFSGSTTHVDVSEPGGIPIGTTLADQFVFTCEAVGDVTIYLYDAPDIGPPSPHDYVIVHQIPEPATICLFGLGGLYLLRRRRK